MCGGGRLFPNGGHIYRNMEDQVGYRQKDRQKLINGIFGSNGLIESKDMDIYDKRLENITSFIEESDKNTNRKTLKPYFENKFYPFLQNMF